MFSKALGYSVISVALLLVAGCSSGTNDLVIQSKFAYPNGDYADLGPTFAEKSVTSFMSPPQMDKALFGELHNEALNKKNGADQLVDYVISNNVTSFGVVPVYQSTFRLEGTAIKFVNAKPQNYVDGKTPSPTRTKPVK